MSTETLTGIKDKRERNNIFKRIPQVYYFLIIVTVYRDFP